MIFLSILYIVKIGRIFIFQSNTLPKTKDIQAEFSSKKSKTTPTVFILEYIAITVTPLPTPTKKPSPTSSPPRPTIPISSAQLEELFTKYSNLQAVNRELLKKIAFCESKLNASAQNGIYAGLFQFSVNTWISTRNRMNLENHPSLRFNPEEAIKTAAFKLATEGAFAWPNCNKF